MDVDEYSSEPEHITPKERGSIQDRGSIIKTSQEISSRGDCEEDLAPNLGTILMKTPTSPKRRKEEDLSRLKKTTLQEIESKSYRYFYPKTL
ncbi:hypothetical protein Lal_00000936 [Lupinus albus]|nr:hypothetical protein Lal_00000936 [Lupinus albus]